MGSIVVDLLADLIDFSLNEFGLVIESLIEEVLDLIWGVESVFYEIHVAIHLFIALVLLFHEICKIVLLSFSLGAVESACFLIFLLDFFELLL